jgi:transposase-like protein
MESGYHSRLGRPPKASTVVKELPVEPIMVIGGRVVPHNCPLCGKGQDPEVIATLPTFIRVRCRSCAKNYQYYPAKTRVSL